MKIRKIQPAPKIGSISREDAKRAAREVTMKRKNSEELGEGCQTLIYLAYGLMIGSLLVLGLCV